MTTTLRLFIDHLETPVGRLTLIDDDEGRLHTVGFEERHDRMERQLRAYSGAPAVALERAPAKRASADALERYFAGDLAAIDALAVAGGGTPFQRAVWSALREIPCGETWSYADLARRIGRPSAVRAVGLANGANPVGVVVPCHRVIGSNGTLTGYGGGIARKRWLLAHETGAPLDLFAA